QAVARASSDPMHSAGYVARRGRGIVSQMGGARRRATYDDLVRVPEPLVAELIEGDLITSPRPALPHALVASTLGMALGPRHGLPGQGRPGGWWIIFEPELHLGEDVLVPDLAGWRQQ